MGQMKTFKELTNDLKEIRVVNMMQRRKMARKMASGLSGTRMVR